MPSAVFAETQERRSLLPENLILLIEDISSELQRRSAGIAWLLLMTIYEDFIQIEEMSKEMAEYEN